MKKTGKGYCFFREKLGLVIFLGYLITSVPIFALNHPQPLSGAKGQVLTGNFFSQDVEKITSRYTDFKYCGEGIFTVKLPEKEGLEFIDADVLMKDGEKFNLQIPLIVRSEFVYTFRFVTKEKVDSVAVAGSFNGWNSNSDVLKREKNGVFELSKELRAGTHHYKFVVDGKWLQDVSNPDKTPDGFGGFNSVVEFEKKEVPLPAGLFEEVKKGMWNISFVLSGSRAFKAVLYYLGKKQEKSFSGDKVSFSIPASSGLETAFLWVVNEQDEPSKTLRIMKNFSDEIFWHQRVIYSIVTDRFYNGDKTNDKPVLRDGLSRKANYIGGDFAGITKKIEEGYFNKLGVNCLWISPVNDNTPETYKDALPPHRLFTGYHGYWPVSQRRVEEHFGSADELKKLVAVAHEHGIKIMADMVFNHVHEEHPWYKEQPAWFGKLELPDGTKNIRKFDEYPFTTWFDEFLPSFDYSNEEAVEAVVDNALWWIKTFDFDAFRLDAVKHIPHNFWKKLREGINQYEQTSGKMFYLLGESIASRKDIDSFISPEELDGQFDFPLYWHIRDTFALGKESFKILSKELNKSVGDYKNVYHISPLLGNHDFPRFMAFADGDITGDEKEIGWERPPAVDNAASYGRIKMAFVFLLTNPGIPMIFYGDEIGLTGAGDPDNRRAMIFENIKKENLAIFALVKKLIDLRSKNPAITMGWHRDIILEDGLWVYLKSYFQNKVIVVFNSDDRKLKVEIPAEVEGERYRSVFNDRIYKTENGVITLKLKPMNCEVLLREG